MWSPLTRTGFSCAYPGSSCPYGTQSTASAATFLAGVWLIVSPFVLDYTATGGEFDGYWNDVTVGVVVALLALVRAVAPREVPWFSIVNIALGGWLIAAPWVLAYNEGVDAPAATVSDMIAGAVVLVAAGLGFVTRPVASIAVRRRSSGSTT